MTLSLNQFKAFEVTNANALSGGAILCMLDHPSGTGDVVGFEHCLDNTTLDDLENEITTGNYITGYSYHDCIEISISCDTYNAFGG